MENQINQERHITPEEWEIYNKIRHCMKKLREKSMMYVCNDESKELYTTRGKHCLQVAKITLDLVTAFNGDRISAVLMGAGHDYGHAVLAHTGESALGRFLISPDEFLPWDGVKPRDGFDHATHSVVALKRECRKEGIELPIFIENGIEAHSTGSKGSSGKYRSFEAECVMRADKIASSISDTQDLIKSGALNIKDKEGLRADFLQSQEVQDTVRSRVFGEIDFNKPSTLTGVMRRILMDAENPMSRNAIEAFCKFKREKDIELIESDEFEKILREFATENSNVIREYVDSIVTGYIQNAVDFLLLSPEEQLETMKGVIIEETKRRNEVRGGVVTGYQEDYKGNQLFVPEQYDAILAAFRGIMIQKEISKEIGKTGVELEALVETVARYIYANKSEFEKKVPFTKWLTDVDGKPFEWKETVAFSLVEMGDMEFRDFAISLLAKEDARDVLRRCRYRDEQDKAWLKRNEGETLPYSEADFSTPERIRSAFETRVGKKTQPSQISKRNSVPGDSGIGR